MRKNAANDQNRFVHQTNEVWNGHKTEQPKDNAPINNSNIIPYNHIQSEEFHLKAPPTSK